MMDVVKAAMAKELGQYRKYGAKKETQSRDSTRHYFRCKHDNCPSKKIVEVFATGEYTIETREHHNHADNAPLPATVPSKRSSEELDRPVQLDEQSLTRSKRASAQNVSNVIRMVKSSTQQMPSHDPTSLPASPRKSPRSPKSVLSQGGSPFVGTAGQTFAQANAFSMSPPPVADVPAHAAVRPDDAAEFDRSSTPQDYLNSWYHRRSPHHATPDKRSITPAVDQLRMDPAAQQFGAMSLATAPAVVGPSQAAGHLGAATPPDPAVAASVQLSQSPEEKPPMVALPPPLPAQPHAGPLQSGSIAVGHPAPIAAPPRVASTPEPAPPTPATAAGNAHPYPGHEGVPVHDRRVEVFEWKPEEGALALLFDGPEKDYSDAYYWRKYGKKTIKGYLYPRFYWRCTHKNCDIKRHTQATEDGRTEVRYYGGHAHCPPPTKIARGGRRAGTACGYAGPSGTTGHEHTGSPASPRSGTAAASSGASPVAVSTAEGSPVVAGIESAHAHAQPMGPRAGLVRDARRRAVGARAMMASDDEGDDELSPSRKRQRRDLEVVPGSGGPVPPTLSRCPLYFLACVAANQAR